MTKVGVIGAAGRMGQTLVSMVDESSELTLGAAIEQPGSPAVGQDSGDVAGHGSNGVLITDDLSGVVDNLDVLIDFTIAPATAANLEVCLKHGTRMVIGTTGLDASQEARLREIGEQIGIVYASNFSVGVNITFKLVENAAKAFGDDVDVEIFEAHHRHKVDAPSGTALSLGKHVAAGLGRDLDKVGIYGREGQTGERSRETIAIHAIRGGEIVGEHTVMFAGAGERLEVTHRAQSRTNFAEGALRAARWIQDQPAGVYDMLDVLNLN